MSITSFISLFGGIALFLYGMNVMGGGLEKMSGGKMEKTLQKLTNNILLSVLLGLVVTATIQSSSATTVIVVGLVNAGILRLKQAIGVIMGANIGTTVTAQIIRLTDLQGDNIFLTLLKPSALAPIIATVGIILYMFCNSSKKKDIGQIFLGFGVLFSGLFAMEAAVAPLKDSPVFGEILIALSNPVLGVLAGAIITAIIQSSSASIGILQALSSTGLLTTATAFPIIMGQNIGTCVTPILASIGASKNAKRSAVVHLYFNIIGTVFFLIVIYAIHYTVGIPMWNDVITKGGIADFHTVFNVVVTVLFIPFAGLLEKIAIKTIRDTDKGETEITILDERFLVSPSLALEQCHKTVLAMADLANKNYHAGVSLLENYDKKLVERIKERENSIDKMEDNLSNYLLKLSGKELSAEESRNVSVFLHLINEYERIGDYAINFQEMAENMKDNNTEFSENAKNELHALAEAVAEIIDSAIRCCESKNAVEATYVEPLEETIDDMEQALKDRHIERLKDGKCSVHSGILFLEMLTYMERISDHCSNIAIYVIGNEGGENRFERHDYLRKLHEGNTESYMDYYHKFLKKYFSKIDD